MATAINIRRDVTDKFYRYKMPKLISKIEGKGNGIKTVIVNMSDIAKALSRPPAYTTKFFGFELGTQVKMDEKNDRYIINGAHDAEKLANLLDIFIDKFVLCADCKNPETEFEFVKNDEILKDCKACGAHLPVDMRHKLVPYILKNKPEPKKDKYQRQTDRAATADNSGDEGGVEEIDAALEAELAALPTAEEVNVEENDWAVDTSADAVAARMAELEVSGAVSKLMDESGESKTLEEFAEHVTSNPDLADEDIVAKAQELDIREDKAITILAQIIFNENILYEEQVSVRAPLLRNFLVNKKCQKGLIGGIERLLVLNHPQLIPGVSLIFKDLYFNDLVEEEVFLAWSEKVSKKYVDKKQAKLILKKAEPFITWLKEAEYEDDEAEE